MTKQECSDFVLKGNDSILKSRTILKTMLHSIVFSIFLGLTLAITRDGSSGGCARLAIINKDGVERVDVLGNDLPKVYDL